jgi:hypothetical protein
MPHEVSAVASSDPLPAERQDFQNWIGPMLRGAAKYRRSTQREIKTGTAWKFSRVALLPGQGPFGLLGVSLARLYYNLVIQS